MSIQRSRTESERNRRKNYVKRIRPINSEDVVNCRTAISVSNKNPHGTRHIWCWIALHHHEMAGDGRKTKMKEASRSGHRYSAHIIVLIRIRMANVPRKAKRWKSRSSRRTHTHYTHSSGTVASVNFIFIASLCCRRRCYSQLATAKMLSEHFMRISSLSLSASPSPFRARPTFGERRMCARQWVRAYCTRNRSKCLFMLHFSAAPSMRSSFRLSVAAQFR